MRVNKIFGNLALLLVLVSIVYLRIIIFKVRVECPTMLVVGLMLLVLVISFLLLKFNKKELIVPFFFILTLFFTLCVIVLYVRMLGATKSVFFEVESLGLRFVKFRWNLMELGAVLMYYIKSTGNELLPVDLVFQLVRNADTPESAIELYESYLVQVAHQKDSMSWLDTEAASLLFQALFMTGYILQLLYGAEKFRSLFNMSESFLSQGNLDEYRRVQTDICELIRKYKTFLGWLFGEGPL